MIISERTSQYLDFTRQISKQSEVTFWDKRNPKRSKILNILDEINDKIV
jgi:hypothetical protein